QWLPTGHSAGPYHSVLNRWFGRCRSGLLGYRFGRSFLVRLDLCNGRRLLVFNGKRTPPGHATFRQRYQLLRVEISATNCGKTTHKYPTTPTSDTKENGTTS